MDGETVFADYLRSGESVCWTGQPDPRRYVFRGAWFSIPFSLLWGGFAVFWETAAVGSNAPLFFDLWGVPFVLIGLYMAFGRFIVARREATTTWYAITDQRVLIRTGFFMPRFIEYELGRLPSLELREGLNGYGTILLEQPPFGWGFMVPGMPGARQPSALWALPHVREVHRMISDRRRR